MRPTRLDRAFFARDALAVAPDLVGTVIAGVGADAAVRARVTEAEAYRQDDPACHAYRRRTERNAPLWGPPGHAYVYRSYGVHWCLNVSTGADGVPQGCLVRAAEPVGGRERLRARRPTGKDRDLLRGPGRLAQALGLDGRHSGADLCGDEAPLLLLTDSWTGAVASGPRVGVSRAADLPWRFWADGSLFVSPYSRSPRAPVVGGAPPVRG